MERTIVVTLLLMTFPSLMATVQDFVLLLMHTNELTVVTLVLTRHNVWESGDVVGMILFQMFHTAFIIPVRAKASFQLTGQFIQVFIRL